jgi:hypothetical protein
MHISMTRILGLVAVAALGACGQAAPGADEPAAEEQTGAAASAQVDGGSKIYSIRQRGVLVASAWAGPDASGRNVEYWVKMPGYDDGGEREFSAESQSCDRWKAQVCSSDYRGARYYRAVFTESPLDCSLPPGPCRASEPLDCELPPGPCKALPPGPCRAPSEAVSFLASGSYGARDDSGSFALTYVADGVEYWAMSHTISDRSVSGQAPLSRPFEGWDDFLRAACASSPQPTTYFQAYYVEADDFCSTTDC